MDFIEWQKRMDPDTCPFRQGATYTQCFGFRSDLSIGPPLHFGTDREAHDRKILSPFDSVFEWRKIPDTVAGSVLQIVPLDGQGDVEIQVFHTVASGRDWQIDNNCDRGCELPFIAGDLGLSSDIHTHTELIFRFSEDLREQLRSLCNELEYEADDVVTARIEQQKMEWGVMELRDHYVIRRGLPEYREPHWGDTATIHVDTKWALKI